VNDDGAFDLLGEALVRDPRNGSRLLGRREYHRLMELTGGSVHLWRRDWQIIPRWYDIRTVRVSLREER